MPRVLVLNGPNLNLLGEREPRLYGATTLADVERRLAALGAEFGIEVACRQSNHEGALIDEVHAARITAEGLIVNAGGLSHTSIALADALRAFDGRIVEVHVTNIHRREPFRHHSHIAPVADAVICGCGPVGYELALRFLAADRHA
jgi:3-dehydroquinate dehydratase-2